MNQNTQVQAVILAAGKGTRMKSPKPKILHRIAGKPLLLHTLTLCQQLSPLPPLVVINGKSKTISKLIKNTKAIPIIENLPQGTGSSVKIAIPYLEKNVINILILNSDDSFLYSQSSIEEMLIAHIHNKNDLTFLTTTPKQFYSNVNRKVIRDSHGDFIDLQPSQTSNEVVCGAYIFKKEWLQKYLPEIKINPDKNEYFITDLLTIALKNASKIEPYMLDNSDEWWGVNTKEDLKIARKLWSKLHHRKTKHG